MDLMPAAAADQAVAVPVTDAPASTNCRLAKPDIANALFQAAGLPLPDLERGRAISRDRLRAVMEAAFGGTDADGAWSWKQAYDACEAAEVLFLRKFGKAMQARAGSPAACLAMLGRIAALLPSHTRRSEESQARQQFSTPLPLGFVASVAAGTTPADLVLEPSAGTGLLAIFAELRGASLALNELAPNRAGLLQHLFPDIAASRHDAAQIHDHLNDVVRPTVVLMNPPFSVGARVEGRVADAGFRHVSSALARLPEGGRLVAITGASLSPDSRAWRDAFVRLQARGRVVFSATIDGRVYARHGTQIDTRLTVIDRVPAEDPAVFPPSPGMSPDCATLLDWVMRMVPARGAMPDRPAARPAISSACVTSQRPVVRKGMLSARSIAPAVSSPSPGEVIELTYEPCAPATASDSARLTEALYEGYSLQSIRIADAKPHPTKLVQSAAMATVAPPRPTYRPHLPAAVLRDGLLSDAQLESVIMAGEAHSQHLAGSWTVDETFDNVIAAPDDAEEAVRFRRGWFLGDGTGAGKGRQVAGVLLDNWLKGRRKALWVSKSDKLLEDAMRDWAALGQERLQITLLARFRQGTPIRLSEGVVFATYATLRSGEREGKVSRLQQILDWLGGEDDAQSFDGVIVFDESHALANAAGDKGARGDKAPSQQGKAGLRLQHALPDARVLYVSATGATTVHNLAYAQRLGLWGDADFPFATRSEFVQAVEAGGVAAMEVLARDMKALGLYAARSLSYDGIEYQLLEHGLTPEQIRIYDAYATAFEVIHAHLQAALEATNITGRGGTLNPQAKSAARSAFESTKQRFFNHLLTAMKTPTLIAMIERDLADGHASVIQLVSTGEALLERRLAEIPSEEWGDIQVDTTPRDAVAEYLLHSFPTQLHEPVSDAEGNVTSVPVWRDGQPVQCREAVERRDRMIEQLASLAPVQAALDQIVQRFGADQVAEVTGRSRRIVRKIEGDGSERLCVETRPASATLAETQAFMDDDKRILVFSDAGGTGRSYHADLGCRNQRLRVHYLLEAGWKADSAIQGLGRSNRTNQAQPPLFRPVTTDVKAEKRFLSTIARRLDTLGAITKGQRQTGGQGLFRADDNLESVYARTALRQLYQLLHAGKVEGCSLQTLQEATGLEIAGSDGTLKEDLPPITTFLNRLLALRIALQNQLFAVFEDLLTATVEGAIASGTYDVGVETVTAESLVITERRTVHTHEATGAETRIFKIQRKDRNQPLPLDEALERASDQRAKLLVNARSGRAAVQLPAPGMMRDDGAVERRVRLLRPMERSTIAHDTLAHSQWREADEDAFAAAWQAEVAEIPEFATSSFNVVTGLLLPIWRRLPEDSMRVYRLQTDDGERVIGRLVSPATLGEVYRNLGLADTPDLSAEDAWAAVTEGKAILHLTDGMQVRRSTVMGLPRVELIGFTDGMVGRLKAMGLTSEIISWKLRLFLPMSAQGPGTLGTVLARHPLTRIIDRAAA